MSFQFFFFNVSCGRLATGHSKAGSANKFGDEQLDVDLAADKIIFDEFKVSMPASFLLHLDKKWTVLCDLLPRSPDGGRDRSVEIRHAPL